MKKLIVRLAKTYASQHVKDKRSDEAFIFFSIFFASFAGLLFLLCCIRGQFSTNNLILCLIFMFLGFMRFERLGYRALLRERESALDTPPPK